jgi:hypothetical protein
LSALLTFVDILVCSFLLAFAIDAALSRPIRQICSCYCFRQKKEYDGNKRVKEEREKEAEEMIDKTIKK